MVLVSFLLFEDSFFEGLRPVKVRIEPCRHGMVKTGTRRVLFRGTRRQDGQEDESGGDDM